MSAEQQETRAALQDEIDSLRRQIQEKQSEIEETKAQVAAVRNMNDQAQQQAAQFETTLHQRWQHVEDQIHMRESHVDPNLINQELQVVQRPTEASLQQQQQTASSQA